MTNQRIDPVTKAQVRSLIDRDLRCATDPQDLKARLARLGYGIRATEGAAKLVTLPHGLEVMDLPAQ